MNDRRKRRMDCVVAGTCLLAVAALAGSGALAEQKKAIPLKEAKLIIEHNATDKDTGFQGFIDSEGWQRIEVAGPEGVVLSFDNFSLVVRGESDSSDQLIYKHAISSISLKGKITVSENKPSQG